MPSCQLYFNDVWMICKNIAAVSTFSVHMFMLWSDWSQERWNWFGYNFYKVAGFGVGFVVGMRGGRVECVLLLFFGVLLRYWV